MLNDEMKGAESIEACTYGRKEKKLERWRLALKMRRWEKNHQVTVYASGVSSEFTPMTDEERLKKAQLARDEYNRTRSARQMFNAGNGMGAPNNKTNRSKVKSKSGYQNLKYNKDGTYTVTVGSVGLGNYPVAQALAKRDKYRSAIGLPPAQDEVKS